MVSGALHISQPIGLAVALVLAATWSAWRRPVRRSRLAIAVLLGGGGLGALALGGPGGHAVGALAAFLAGIWLARSFYGPEPLSRARRAVLVTLRVIAWTVALALLGRPGCQREVITWDKPILPVVLDTSASMALTDGVPGEPNPPSRAARANAALAAAQSTLRLLDERYDVRLLGSGAPATPLDRWDVQPTGDMTALAGALRAARSLRTARGRVPPAVLLLSDGAENAATPADVRAAAETLARQRTALVAVGVGPEPEQTPLVEFDPLALPARVRLREQLHVGVTGRVQGCRGVTLAATLLWGATEGAAATIAPTTADEALNLAFDTLPPGPGVQRVTVRVTLPAELGGHAYSTSTTVEVVAERVRILWLERRPHQEAAFATRAWRGDDTFEVVREPFFTERGAAPDVLREAERFSAYDVIVVGAVGPRLPQDVLDALAIAVRDRGTGVLLAGGRELFNGRGYARTALADLAPVLFDDEHYGLPGPLRFIPTPAGDRHSLLRGVDEPAARPSEAIWAGLPPLGSAAALGDAKPAAEILATDEAGRALLVAHEIGRGRCVAAGWESTWGWALASEDGFAMHRRLWRRLALWLANRRPRAWVVTDQPEYALAALAGGQRQIRIDGGLSGRDLTGSSAQGEVLSATLMLHDPAGSPARPVRLERTGDTWSAALPDAELGTLAPGTHALEFTVRAVPAERAAQPPAETSVEYTARAAFAVVATQLELRPPTANLGLLRAAAERTGECGGRYLELTELGPLLAELAARDERVRVTTTVRYDVVEREAWGLLAWLLVAVTLEWAVRKRAGLP